MGLMEPSLLFRGSSTGFVVSSGVTLCALLLLLASSFSAYASGQITLGTGLNVPVGVAVDSKGNVYIADCINSRVVELPAGGGAQTTVGTGFTYPTGLALDSSGQSLYLRQGQVIRFSRLRPLPAPRPRWLSPD